MRTLADLFKALSDETRLQMLAMLLRRGELCVCDFVESMGISQSKASRHLRYLLHSGLVQDRRDAAWVFYRVHDAPGSEATAVLNAIRPVLAAQDLGELERQIDRWIASKHGATDSCRKVVPRAAAR